jgi:hypothetical protein
MIKNNNRVEDFAPQHSEEESPSQSEPPSLGELAEYAALAREWAMKNPLPCMAAAFAAGAAIAWIIKRK